MYLQTMEEENKDGQMSPALQHTRNNTRWKAYTEIFLFPLFTCLPIFVLLLLACCVTNGWIFVSCQLMLFFTVMGVFCWKRCLRAIPPEDGTYFQVYGLRAMLFSYLGGLMLSSLFINSRLRHWASNRSDESDNNNNNNNNNNNSIEEKVSSGVFFGLYMIGYVWHYVLFIRQKWWWLTRRNIDVNEI
jgi:hypothetical protein